MPVEALADLKRSPSLAEQIYQRLRHQLRSGTFAPGERLVETALAARLVVSRSPVREALGKLASDGLLDTRGTGYQVMAPTERDMDEIFEMRRLLEPPAARRAARLMTPATVDQLSGELAKARAAEHDEGFVAFNDANYAFREAWVALVPSRRLQETILRFDDQAGFVRRTTLILPEARATALGLLERLTVAFRDRDENAAAQFTEAFIDEAARYYRQVAAASPSSSENAKP